MDTRGTTVNVGMVNGFDPNNIDQLDPVIRQAVKRRQDVLGPAYRLMYGEPVEVKRASGVLMYDSDGRDYLDAYNNVVSVGHCHPRVVADVHRQMQTLCTHTRYIQDGILDFAEDILSTFEDHIEHMMFTCTGSEANDLALRIAKHHTGKNGIIITSEAYHGNSHLTAGLSPSLGKRSALGTWVRRVPAPDSYRMDPSELGKMLADHVAREIAELERRGDGVAAFIADSLFSSDGIYAHPVDVLAPIAEVVRKAGGLFIADEVQSGFGRSGERLWGYQRHGVLPDIVTLGKPMGNGFPVAAVALSPHAIREFGSDMRYFNTFGGNSVAIAAAQSVLNIIRDEGLMENANRVGTIIMDGLRAIAAKDGRIGDVRGAGLYVGVEFVSDKGSRLPDAATALAVVAGLRKRRVLISATGPDSNILKIRPPLIFSAHDADRLLTQLEATLESI